MSLIPGLYPSPLRYPGGKGKVANFIKVLMLENQLVGKDYVEPYAGGASVALSLLFEEYADAIHINDLNAGVYSFWYAVLNDTDELCDRIMSVDLTMHEWHRQREVAATTTSSGVDLGFATFYLNRTNRSGIIKGGVIGGKTQHGDWRLDARFNRQDLIGRIRKIRRHRSRIHLSNQDAAEFLQPWTQNGQPASFLYLDPPYFVKGQGLYDNFYTVQDHAALAEMVQRITHPWIVSYDAAPQTLSLYRPWRSLRYSLNYSANTRGHGAEMMFFSADLSVPQFAPSAVTTKDVIRLRNAA